MQYEVENYRGGAEGKKKIKQGLCPFGNFLKFWKFLQKLKLVLYVILSLYQKVFLRLVYYLQKKEKSLCARQHAVACTLVFQRPTLKQ